MMLTAEIAGTPAPDDILDLSPLEKLYPGGLPEEQRTKYRIFLAAARLFAHKGYNGTAVREIVQKAGVTKPALYYYFNNKEELYTQLIDLAMDTFSRIVVQTVEFRGTRRERLLRLFGVTLGLFEEHLDLLRLVNIIFYAPRGAVPPYDLKPRLGIIHSALRETLNAPSETEAPIRQDRAEVALVLLIGLFRSMQVHLLVRELGSPLTIDQISAGIDMILESACAASITDSK